MELDLSSDCRASEHSLMLKMSPGEGPLATVIITVDSESQTRNSTCKLESFQKRQVGWQKNSHNSSLFIEHLLSSKS